jgi:excisionase family DNA binding protein
MSVLTRLSEAATSAVQAVIIPSAVISIALSALALTLRRKYVTAQQAGEYLGVSARTIRTKIAEGVFTGYRLPGPNSQAIRLDLNEIDQVMQRIPAVIKPKEAPFGPDARIVEVDPEELAESDGQDEGGDEG